MNEWKWSNRWKLKSPWTLNFSPLAQCQVPHLPKYIKLYRVTGHNNTTHFASDLKLSFIVVIDIKSEKNNGLPQDHKVGNEIIINFFFLFLKFAHFVIYNAQLWIFFLSLSLEIIHTFMAVGMKKKHNSRFTKLYHHIKSSSAMNKFLTTAALLQHNGKILFHIHSPSRTNIFFECEREILFECCYLHSSRALFPMCKWSMRKALPGFT